MISKYAFSKRIFSAALFWTLLLLMQVTAFAEGDAAIKGAVTDPNGAVIATAQVSVTNASTNEQRKIRTDSDGHYELSGLAPGSYRIDITAPGFAPASKPAQLAAGDNMVVDFQLVVEALTNTVTVASYAVNTSTTGTKTETLLLDVPQSIQVIPHNVIEDQHAKTIGSILQNASGFSQTTCLPAVRARSAISAWNLLGEAMCTTSTSASVSTPA